MYMNVPKAQINFCNGTEAEGEGGRKWQGKVVCTGCVRLAPGDARRASRELVEGTEGPRIYQALQAQSYSVCVYTRARSYP